MFVATQYQIEGASARAIASSVEQGVRSARLEPGERLPSVRRLAAGLGVSPTTVAAAYAELQRRGIVLSEERRGAVIAHRPPVAEGRIASPLPPGVRDVSSGNPDPALLPALGPALARIEPSHDLYGIEPTLPALAELARADLGALGVPADHLTVVSGALDGVERVLAAHLRPGDPVVVEDPGYPSTVDLLRALGHVPVPVPIDDAGLLPAPLERALRGGAKAVLLTPRGQNPTGAALDERRAEELVRALQGAPDALVVEDDHLGIVAGVRGFTTVSGRARWAFVRSVAKSLGPGLRLAVLAGDAETVARVEGRLRLGPGWVSHVLQRLVATLLADAEVGALLERAATAYRERRRALLDALADRGLSGQGRTGLNVWVAVPDETAAVQALLAAGYAATAGAAYRLASPPAVRVTVSTLLEEEAVEIASALAGLRGPGARLA